MSHKSFDLDLSRLTESSREFATFLFDRLPETRAHARMESSSIPNEFSLLVTIPSPTGDLSRSIVIWMEQDVEPSVEFGEWHTHSGLFKKDVVEQFKAIINLVQGILADQIVLTYDVGGQYGGHCGIIDLRDHDALLEELTNELSPGRVKLKSWSSASDKEIGLDDVNLD